MPDFIPVAARGLGLWEGGVSGVRGQAKYFQGFQGHSVLIYPKSLLGVY